MLGCVIRKTRESGDAVHSALLKRLVQRPFPCGNDDRRTFRSPGGHRAVGAAESTTRFPPIRLVSLELRDRVAPVGLHRLHVRPIHNTAQIDIVAEVAGIDHLVFVGVNLLLVRFVDDAIAIDIGREETKRNVAMLLAVAVDVLHPQRDDFRTRHPSHLSGHGCFH